MSASAKSWQQSYGGKVVTPYDLRPEQVSFEDIPHALAQKIRFNGQCTVMGYTVAQHTYLGAKHIASLPGPDGGVVDGRARQALAFLLHEVSEVYLPDVPSPVKSLLHVEVPDPARGPMFYQMIPWHVLEYRHAEAVFKALGLSDLLITLDDPLIKDTDLRMLMTEKRDLMGPSPQEWGFTEQPFDFKITDIWEPQWAEDRWTAMYKILRKRASL